MLLAHITKSIFWHS